MKIAAGLLAPVKMMAWDIFSNGVLRCSSVSLVANNGDACEY